MGTTLLVLNGRGRKLLRLRLPRQTKRMILVGLGAASSLLLMLAVHGLTRIGAARETRRLARENAELQQLTVAGAAELESARAQVLQVGSAFDQLRRKSGMGWSAGEPAGVGPLSDSDGSPAAVSLAQLEPGLSQRMANTYRNATAMQRTLTELLEYFHDAERLLSNTPSINPTRTRAQTSGFGKRRDPMNSEWRVHKGVDLSGQVGQSIHAPADGIVIFAGLRGGYGNTLVLDHGYGLQTHFAHLSGFRTKLGQRVRRGDVIAAMGSTGKSTGPHLHYEVRRFGEPLNPEHFILD